MRGRSSSRSRTSSRSRLPASTSTHRRVPTVVAGVGTSVLHVNTRPGYRRGMHVRSGIARWGLLVVLTLGVVLMHHAPGQHGLHSPPPHSATASTAVSTAEQGRERPHSAEHGDMPASSPHQLLHLCLAILLGFATFLFFWRRRRPATLASHSRRWLSLWPQGARPPVPLARRLAVLCVMRC